MEPSPDSESTRGAGPSIPAVKRTYGRKHPIDASATDDFVAAPINPLVISKPTTTSIFDDEGDSDKENGLSPGVEKDFFGWRKKLADIDDEMDEDLRTVPSTSSNHLSNATLSSKAAHMALIPPHSPHNVSGAPSEDTLLPQNTALSKSRPATLVMSKKSIRSFSVDGLEASDEDNQARPSRLDSSPTSPDPFRMTPSPSKPHSSQTPPTSNIKSSLLSNRNNLAQSSQNSLNSDDDNDDSPRVSADNKSLKPRLKGLTKKEKREAAKEHARIVADQQYNITRKLEQMPIPLSELFQKMKAPKKSADPSDPIQDFTSSPRSRDSSSNRAKLSYQNQSAQLDKDSDDELPDVREVLQRKTDDKTREGRLAAAAKIKRIALQAKRNSTHDSDSDDLEIEKTSSRAPVHHRKSAAANYEKKLANIAGFTTKGASTSALPRTTQALQAAAKPTFGNSRSRRGDVAIDNKELQNLVRERVKLQVSKITSEKDREWVRRGGTLKGKEPAADLNLGLDSFSKLVTRVAEKHQMDREAADADGSAEESDDDSDGEWDPEAENSQPPNGVETEVETCGVYNDSDEDSSKTEDHENTSDDNDQENVPVPRPSKITRYHKRAVASDSEDDESSHPVRRSGRVLVPDTSIIIDDFASNTSSSRKQTITHRGSLSSFDESTPDEEDKENDTRLMFDRSEDKENITVPRFAQAQRSESASNENLFMNSLRNHHGSKEVPGEVLGADPDQTMIGGDISRSFSSTVVDDEIGTSASPKPLQPAFGDSSSLGFTQFFDDDDSASFNLKDKVTGMHDKVLSSVKRPTPLRRVLSDICTSPEIAQPNFFDRIRRQNVGDDLPLTLDSKLQPSLEVTTQVRRKADVIFEKEQLFLLEEAAEQEKGKTNSEVYITENGLLTQTKPDVSNPLIYRQWSPTQAPAIEGPSQNPLRPHSSQRIPFHPLSLDESPKQLGPLSRLRKGKDTGQSPTQKARDVFSTMMMNAKAPKRDKTVILKETAEFVEGEAVESDEEDSFGFGAKSKDDDDDDAQDDPNAVVEGLVDDAVMDADTLNEDKVLEVVKEQQEQDDVALQKYHQDAIEGKFRGKRRSGAIGMEVSDSESDDDDKNRRLRQALKKRKIDGDTLDDLGNNPVTVPYYNAYQADVQEDENDDFSHLNKDDMDVSEDDGEEEEKDTISRSELEQQLREAARTKDGAEEFDPDNVEWVAPSSNDLQELEIETKDVSTKSVSLRRIAANEDPEMRRSKGHWNPQLRGWGKEQSARSVSTAGVKAASVTGHASKSNSSKRQSQDSASSSERRKIARNPSALASLPGRQSRFAS